MGRLCGSLEFVGFLGVGKAGEGGRRAVAGYLYADGGVALRAGLAEDSESGQRFAINLGNQEVFPAFVPLPNLADLNLPHGHRTNVEGFAGCVNTSDSQ